MRHEALGSVEVGFSLMVSPLSKRISFHGSVWFGKNRKWRCSKVVSRVCRSCSHTIDLTVLIHGERCTNSSK